MAKGWFNKILPSFVRRDSSNEKKSPVPQGLWQSCPNCKEIIYGPDLESNLYVCTNCDHHIRIGARHRLSYLFDEDSYEEISSNLEAKDWLSFKDSKKYKDRLSDAQSNIDEKEAMISAIGKINGKEVVISAFEFRFMGGSMGSVVGQKFIDAANKAIEMKCPFICFSTSGGARMQESLFSLFQMARTSAVLNTLKENKLPYISVLTDPIFGGVAASLAMLGDINIAEPKAQVGFAGPRVIEDTVRVKLPDGFQRSEFLLNHGMIDMIVHRSELKNKLSGLISKLHR
ncbi:acetyl-CoA carboxylase, carboxyltransferase subunit beta [SAR86 cluster bacterium]|jgi:acetyl-CoA carboxylase carboxyl transferase subunit beta|nr:acetyl-CoA carboxylase, carboxyltransferase subunit beta [SAR86 cluster bacterium]|tara:strand:+ start:183 stop:1043 length:861 start_codon:yes stop_codon:yes gene_type:complete